MEHYICTGGCGAVVERPGVCQAMNCPKHGQPLNPCNCTDNKHYGKVSVPSGSGTTPEETVKEKKWWQFWK